LLLAAAAVIYFLPDSFEWPRWQGAGLPADQPASQASAPEQTADGILPVPAASDALVLDPAAPSSAAASDVAASEVGQPASVASLPVQALGTMPAAPSAPAAASAAATVFLTATEDSWIEVIDGGGTTRLARIVRAGESMDLGGGAPWRLRIGPAGGGKVTLRGQPVDLTPFTRNNVARLELK